MIGFGMIRRRIFTARAAVTIFTLGLPSGNQMLLAIPDKIFTPHLLQGFTQHGPIGRVVVTQKGFV
jgi:hypothetical protein